VESSIENQVKNSTSKSLLPEGAIKNAHAPSTKDPHTPSYTLGVPDTPGTTNTPGNWAVTDDRWLKDKHHWTDTAAGKAGIEFISRITLGGIFYSLMENSQAMKNLGTYSRSKHEARVEKGEALFLEKIAFAVDNTFGKTVVKLADKLYFRGALQKEYNPITKREEVIYDSKGEAVLKARQFARFRENRNIHSNQTRSGRSLGAEMTVVTASFAAMSAGSALMRNLLSGLLNPKERASWSKDGKFDAAHIAKKTAGKVWEIGTYNAGEDAAVALPYVFYMRWQRNILDKAFKGFKYSSDGVDNGGGYRIDDNGRVRDHMLLAGAADLQGRFTVYNVFTQLYRDIYDNIGGGIKQWWKGDKTVSAPSWIKNPSELPSTAVSGTKHLLRYSIISAIRSIIQMTPSVPFFSVFRVPGSKINGMAVHADHGALHFLETDKKGNVIKGKNGKAKLGASVRANLGAHYFKGDYYNDKGERGFDSRYKYLSQKNRKVENLPPMGFADDTSFDKPTAFFYRSNADGTGPHPTKAFNPNGYANDGRELANSMAMKLSDKVARWMHKTAENDTWAKATDGLFKFAGYKGDDKATKFARRRLAKESLMAGIPYASYFAAKVYTRDTYVNEQMNMGIERAIDGLLGFNRKEVAAGIAEISNTVMHQPLEDPERQTELIGRHLNNGSDRSPRPTDWNANLHADALSRKATNTSLDRKEVITTLNEERNTLYAKKYGNSSTKDNLLAKDKSASWKEKQTDSAEVEAQTHLS